MAGRDGTGPLGRGRVTGRGAGFCAGNRMGGYGGFCGGRGAGQGFDRGVGQGFGRGQQNQSRSFSGIQRLDSKETIQERVAFLEEEIKNAREQLGNISDSEV